MDHDDTSSYSRIQDLSNVNYKSDIKRTLQYTKILLEILGLWSIGARDTRRGKKYISKVLVVMSHLAMIFPIIPAFMHIIMRERGLIARLVRLCPISFVLINLIIYVFIILRSETIRLSIENVMNDWMTIKSEKDREIMIRNSTAGRNLTLLCGFFMYTGGMSFQAIVPCITSYATDESNVTVRPLVYPGFDMFVDAQSSPTYEIIYVLFCVSGFVTFTVTIVSCNFAALFVTHACGQIQIIISRLMNLVDGINEFRNSDELQKRISFIIKSHAKVLRLSSSTEDVLQEIIFLEIISSTLIMCVMEYCVMDWENTDTVLTITYLILIASLFFNLFIFCYIGELLKEQCHEVGTATAMMEWYRLPGKTGMALVMIVAIANRPRKLTAGGMMELSISSFGGIIKTSFVYMNMLRTMA